MRRKWSHFNSLKNGTHNDIFQLEYDSETNKSNFIFEILLICRKEDRILYEQLFIDKISPRLNISKTAGVLDMTQKIKNKIRNGQLKNWKNNVYRKEKASQTTKNILLNPEIKEKQRIGIKKAWDKNPKRRKIYSLNFTGDNNPSKNLNIRKKISDTKKKDTQRICRISWYNSSIMQQKYWGA
jgi:hypothetical protein